MSTDARPHGTILRPMLPSDLPDAIDLWVAAWRAAYPAIDFEARRDWIAGRIAELERGGAQAVVALRAGRIAGVLVVDPASGYLDQLVVATEAQGTGIALLLLAHARRLSPARLSLHVNRDNARAIRFYEKHGFARTGEDTNPRSGAPTYRMEWQA
jgi:putative acetyltransferase